MLKYMVKINATTRENIKKFRKMKGWTQQDLADISGVPKRTIAEAERNKNTTLPQQNTLSKLAAALGVEPGDFFVQHDSDKPFVPQDLAVMISQLSAGQLEFLRGVLKGVLHSEKARK